MNIGGCFFWVEWGDCVGLMLCKNIASVTISDALLCKNNTPVTSSDVLFSKNCIEKSIYNAIVQQHGFSIQFARSSKSLELTKLTTRLSNKLKFMVIILINPTNLYAFQM